MEILSNSRGKPILALHGSAAERAAHLGLYAFDLSLTHSRSLAIAFVVALKHPTFVDSIES
jgi:holo-[acyl-carrier protein] synthase